MTRLSRLSFALVVGLLAASSAQADTMRCGQRLVATGDSPYDVRSRCGEPDDQQRRVEMRSVSRWVSGPCLVPGQLRCGQYVEHTTEVVIDEWLYDFGPHRFIQRLTFEQGRLIAVVSGSRGNKR